MKVYDDQHTAKDEWVKVKDQPLKVRIQWIWDYYSLIIICTAAAIAIGISIFCTVKENSVPNVIQIEIYSEEIDQDHNEEFKEMMCEILDLNPDEYHVDVSSCIITTTEYDVYDAQALRLSARVAASDLDILIGTPKIFNDYFTADAPDDSYLIPLNYVLSDELLAKLEEKDLLYYLTNSKGEEIAVGINLVGSRFYNLYEMIGKQSYAGIVANHTHDDAIIAFFENFALE